MMRLNKTLCAMKLGLLWASMLLLVAVPPSNLQSVRLASTPLDQTGITEGRIEVYNKGEWKDVCHHQWDRWDAQVVCKQLGYAGVSFAMVESYYGEGSNNGSLQNFDCGGDERVLDDCSFKTADKTCREGETAGASCYFPGYLGCFLDRTIGSVLTDASMSSDDMTIRKCLQYCYDQKMRYAGLRKETDCHCGANGTVYDSWGLLSDTNCQERCGGNQAEVCGGRTTWFWSTSIYDVDQARCPKSMEPDYGFVRETGAFWYGSTATFDCYTGYRLQENHTLSCVLGNEPNEVMWEGEMSMCQEIPKPTKRNKDDEQKRIMAQAQILKGTRGTVKLKVISLTRIIIGSVVGFLICVVISVTIVIIIRKERRANPSPKIRRQEEASGSRTEYQLTTAISSTTSDDKI